MGISALSLGKCRIEQDIEMLIIGEQVYLAVPPFTVGLFKFIERRSSALVNQSRSPVDELLDLFGLFGRRRSILGTGRICQREAG